MLPLTLGVFVYSLFMRVELICVCHITLDYIYYYLPLYDQQFTPYLIIVMVMYLVNIFTHHSHPLGKCK